MQAARWRTSLLLGLILAGGAALRLYGLEWDGGHWLHPDERQIYFLALDLGWPSSLGQAVRPDSPLNPGFFAYGSLPIYLLRGAAELLAAVWPVVRDPDALHLAGRLLAVAFDLGTVYLTYRLGSREWASGEFGNGREGMVAAGLVAVAVVHVQAAHFYVADVMLTFFVMLALNLAFDVAGGGGKPAQVGLGLATGLALATKVSGAPLLLLPIVAYLIRGHDTSSPPQKSTNRPIYQLFPPIALTFLLAGAAFVVVQPYALLDWGTFLSDTVREAQIGSGRLDVPYTRQYAGTVPYLYPAWQMALWGLGLPAGVAAWVGFGVLLARWLRRGPAADSLLLAWAGPYLALAGLLYAKPLRYMLPLVPVLCLLAAGEMRRWGRVGRRILGIRDWGLGIGAWGLGLGAWGLGAVVVGYAVVFVGMYGEAHPWVEASEWIYREVEAGSVVTVEEWDTALPLPLEVDGKARRIEEYDVRTLRLYDEPDDAAKWRMIAADLAQSETVVIASRRLYGSISRLPERYPVAANYYRLLLGGNLGFELAGEFTRGPEWLNPRVPPLSGAAPWVLVPDESLVVYDHPRALVFRNVARLPADVLFERVTGGEE
ncbi:MAG: hypothetical protein JXA93_22475 [Anaerolineae bacterium]|nr:hypothetical protein [Anaerolineae bacterium]